MTTDKSGPDLGRYLYSIAVIADTHMNEEEYGSASPYECNRVANSRTRWVINQQKAPVDRLPANRRDPSSGTARRIDLETGRVSPVRWRRVDDALEIEGGIACAVPTLIWFGA